MKSTIGISFAMLSIVCKDKRHGIESHDDDTRFLFILFIVHDADRDGR